MKYLSLIILFCIALLTGCNANAVQDNDIYRNLPEKPSNFDIVQREVLAGSYPDICELQPNVYLRPEFYPNWEFAKQYFYDNYDFSRWGVNGYGMYPAESGIEVTNLKKGEVITFCSFLKTGYGIQTYQGIELYPEYNEYFDVIPDPSIFLLEPTFPIFDDKWVRKIKIMAIAKKDVPIGEYEINLNIVKPSALMEKQFAWDVIDKEVNINKTYMDECERYVKSDNPSERCEEIFTAITNKYVSGGSWNIGREMYKAVIRVS